MYFTATNVLSGYFFCS